MDAVKEFFAHWWCVLRHRVHHFQVAGNTLCRICDAELLDYIINVTNNKLQSNALSEFAAGADAGLAGRK